MLAAGIGVFLWAILAVLATARDASWEFVLAVDILVSLVLVLVAAKSDAARPARAAGVVGAGLAVLGSILQFPAAGFWAVVWVLRVASLLLGAWAFGVALRQGGWLRTLGFVAAGLYGLGPFLFAVVTAAPPYLWLTWHLPFAAWLVCSGIRPRPRP